ncbi:MAG: TetR/AcrR family transcriptional regulator [Myxococcota bacterium]
MASQRERSEATRARVLEAAVRVLVEHGFADATTTRIVKEAGVSRGAMLHHFPTKAVLMQEVLAYVLRKREEAFHHALAQAKGDDPVATVIEAFWEAVGAEEAFVPWLELTVAARTQPALQAFVAEAGQALQAVIDENFRTLFDVEDRPELDVLPTLGTAVLQGLAMRNLARGNPEGTKAALDAIKQLATLLLGSHRPR